MMVDNRNKRQIFRFGDMVRYVPTYVGSNIEHPDCEDGMVTSQNESSVFVRFVTNGNANGWQGRWWNVANSEACRPEDLILLCRPE